MTTSLEELLPPQAEWWAAKFGQFMSAILDKAARRAEPVPSPDGATLRAMLWACKTGRDGARDLSPEWRRLWAADDDTVQSYIRGAFQIIKDVRFPADRIEKVVAALADHLVALHEAAAEQQKAHLRKKAERSPAHRMQAAGAALATLEPFQTALLAWCEAARDASGAPFVELAQNLPLLRKRLEQELAR